MKAVISIGDLATALSRNAEITTRGLVGSAASGVLISADASGLILTSTDFNIEVTRTVAAEVATAGRLVVTAHQLADILRALPADGEACLEMLKDERALRVFSGRSKFKVPALPADGFPAFRRFRDEPAPLEIDAAALAGALAAVSGMPSRDETRPFLASVHMHEHAGALRVIGTNGKRMAAADLAVPGVSGFPPILLSLATAHQLQALARDAEEPVRLIATTTYISAAAGKTRLLSRLVNADMPNYLALLPGEPVTRATVDSGELAAAIRRMQALDADRARTLHCRFAPGVLELSTDGANGGEADDAIELAALEGAGIEALLGAPLMLDALGALKAEAVSIEFVSAHHPVIWRPAEPAPRWALIMPRRI